jgi:hypothetical protein
MADPKDQVAAWYDYYMGNTVVITMRAAWVCLA